MLFLRQAGCSSTHSLSAFPLMLLWHRYYQELICFVRSGHLSEMDLVSWKANGLRHSTFHSHSFARKPNEMLRNFFPRLIICAANTMHSVNKELFSFKVELWFWGSSQRRRKEKKKRCYLVLFPKSDCRSQCPAVWTRHCRSLRAHTGRLPSRYKGPACPASSCCSPQRCRS